MIHTYLLLFLFLVSYILSLPLYMYTFPRDPGLQCVLDLQAFRSSRSLSSYFPLYTAASNINRRRSFRRRHRV